MTTGLYGRGVIRYMIQNFLKPPQALSIHPTGKCNLKCRMCDSGYEGKGKEFLQRNKALIINDAQIEMTSDQWKDAIFQFSKLSPGAIVGLSGGEPFVYPGILDIIQAVLDNSLKLRIVSNGTVISPWIRRMSELCAGNQIDINISIDGPPLVHDAIRGVAKSYEKALAAMDELLSYGDTFRLSVTTTISDLNASVIFNTIEGLLNRYGNDLSAYTLYHPWHRTNEMVSMHNMNCPEYPTTTANVGVVNYKEIDTIVLLSEINKIKQCFKNIRIVPDLEGKEIDTYYHYPTIPVTGKVICKAPYTKLLITPSGDILVNALCFAGILGNVKRNTLLEIWNGDSFSRFREKMKGRICPGCFRCCDLFVQ